VKGQVVGTFRNYRGHGSATFLGYRPRDDQSKSLGYETRNWFEVLTALGAYPPTGCFAGVDDNTEYLSRTTNYLACHFPNGTVAIAPHLRELEEDWPGGFARDPDRDKKYMEAHPLPPDEIHLKDFKVNGHTVTYDGTGAVAFRIDKNGDLIAFSGGGSTKIMIDGREFIFADQPVGQIAWAPVPAERRVKGGAVLQMMIYGTGKFHIPANGLPGNLELLNEGPIPGSRGQVIPSSRKEDLLFFEINDGISGRWIYGVETN
jgi:hypothetical protein